MVLNQAKLNVQNQIIDVWKQQGHKGTVVAVTGFGKSFVGVLLIKEMNARVPERQTMVVVPSLYLQSQWQGLVQEHKLKNVTVMVINSAVKDEIRCDFLILDEIHRYASEVFFTIFQKVSYRFILGLTATIERQDQRHQLIELHCPVIYRLTMKDALDHGFVSQFSIYNLQVNLSPDALARYKTMSKQMGRYFAVFGQDLSTVLRATKDKALREQLARQWGKTPNEIVRDSVQFIRLMQARKKLLHNNEEKQRLAVEIAMQHPEARIITFSETAAFADTLTQQMGSYACTYHSGMTKKQREVAMEGFKNGTFRVINTARALDEGMDIEGLDMAVICAGTSTQRQQIQRMGRAIRFVPGKQAVIVNLFVADTRDEHWLRSRQRGMPHVYWINDVNDIEYGEPDVSDSPDNTAPRVQFV